jgi:hypothetical protein
MTVLLEASPWIGENALTVKGMCVIRNDADDEMKIPTGMSVALNESVTPPPPGRSGKPLLVNAQNVGNS